MAYVRKIAVWTDQAAFDSWLVTADADKGLVSPYHLTECVIHPTDGRAAAWVHITGDANLLTQGQIDTLMTYEEAITAGFYPEES